MVSQVGTLLKVKTYMMRYKPGYEINGTTQVNIYAGIEKMRLLCIFTLDHIPRTTNILN